MRRCRAFADARALTVAGVFKDAAESGAHLERADLQRLLTEARSPRCRFQTVLVDDLSRLSRDLGERRCGECGSTMRVVSLKRKAGRAYANFGCSAHHGKGAAICGNGLVISERKLNRAVIDELRKLLASKEIQARFIDGFTKRLHHKNPSDAVARFLEKVLEIAENAPKRASVSLSRILVPITLVPVKAPDGTRRYEARGALNTNPAVLSDGRAGSANDGCGGRI